MDAFREQEPEEGFGRGSLRGQVIVFGCLIERNKDRHGYIAHMHDVEITSTVPPMARQVDRLDIHDAVQVKGTLRRQTHQSVGGNSRLRTKFLPFDTSQAGPHSADTHRSQSRWVFLFRQLFKSTLIRSFKPWQTCCWMVQCRACEWKPQESCLVSTNKNNSSSSVLITLWQAKSPSRISSGLL